MVILSALAVATAISGGANKAEDVTASYVSPMTYTSLTCNQIVEEANRVSSKVGEISGVQNKKASDDAVATGVALIVFWPTVFFIKGDKQSAGELGRLKGELDALEQASIQKKCGIIFKKSEQVKPA